MLNSKSEALDSQHALEQAEPQKSIRFAMRGSRVKLFFSDKVRGEATEGLLDAPNELDEPVQTAACETSRRQPACVFPVARTWETCVRALR